MQKMHLKESYAGSLIPLLLGLGAPRLVGVFASWFIGRDYNLISNSQHYVVVNWEPLKAALCLVL